MKENKWDETDALIEEIRKAPAHLCTLARDHLHSLDWTRLSLTDARCVRALSAALAKRAQYDPLRKSKPRRPL